MAASCWLLRCYDVSETAGDVLLWYCCTVAAALPFTLPQLVRCGCCCCFCAVRFVLTAICDNAATAFVASSLQMLAGQLRQLLLLLLLLLLLPARQRSGNQHLLHHRGPPEPSDSNVGPRPLGTVCVKCRGKGSRRLGRWLTEHHVTVPDSDQTT